MARPRFHALATVPVAWAVFRRWGRAAGAGFLLTGIFVDFDHLADYVWVRWQRQRTHFLAPLHAWELAAAGGAYALWRRRRAPAHPCVPFPPDDISSGAAAPDDLAPDIAQRHWKDDLFSGLVAGLLFHLVQDVLTNRPRHPGVYALTYRIAHRFRRERIGWKGHKTFHDWSSQPWYTWL